MPRNLPQQLLALQCSNSFLKLIPVKHCLNFVENHVSRNIGIISRIWPFVNTVALLLYFSLASPYITYCNIIWASTYNTHLHQLNVLQKQIIRIIFLLAPLSSIVSAFTNNSLLNRLQIRNLQTALFMFSYDFNSLPKIFSGFFISSNNYNNPSHFLRNAHEYSPSFSKSTLKLFSIQCYGPRLYSSISSSIKDLIQFNNVLLISFIYCLKSRINNIYCVESYSLWFRKLLPVFNDLLGQSDSRSMRFFKDGPYKFIWVCFNAFALYITACLFESIKTQKP